MLFIQAVEPKKRNKFISDTRKILENYTIASNEYASMLNDYGITALFDNMLANANTDSTNDADMHDDIDTADNPNDTDDNSHNDSSID